jgi:hypothetical protein
VYTGELLTNISCDQPKTVLKRVTDTSERAKKDRKSDEEPESAMRANTYKSEEAMQDRGMKRGVLGQWKWDGFDACRGCSVLGYW